MNKILKFWKIWRKSLTLNIQDAMAYKVSFFSQVLALFLGDMIIPIVSTLIYSVSAGIPGWSLNEFILFQGTIIIVIGIWHTLFAGLLGETINSVKEGTYDKILLRPMNTLAYMTSKGFDLDGAGEVLAGVAIAAFALIRLKIFSFMLIPYFGVILLGALFYYSLTIFAASFAFIFVKTWRLFEFISAVERFGRYPLNIYNGPLRIFLTYFVPVAFASYFPAAVLLGKEPILRTLLTAIPVFIFFAVSVWSWHYAMKKYSSAGG